MLDEKEIEILLEALDDWVESVQRKDAMGSLLSGLFVVGRGEDAQKTWQSSVEKDAVEAKTQTKIRQEQVIFIKAKLLKMRDSITVNDAANVLRGD